MSILGKIGKRRDITEILSTESGNLSYDISFLQVRKILSTCTIRILATLITPGLPVSLFKVVGYHILTTTRMVTRIFT